MYEALMTYELLQNNYEGVVSKLHEAQTRGIEYSEDGQHTLDGMRQGGVEPRSPYLGRAEDNKHPLLNRKVL